MINEARPGNGNERGKIIEAELALFSKHPEWFYAFLKNTDQKAIQSKVLIEGLKLRYPNIWERVSNPAVDLKILMLGAGVGTSEIAFLEEVRERRGLENVSAYYEDPSPQMAGGFRYAAYSAGVESIVKQYEDRHFEDPSYHPPNVDITLAFQLWHYVDNWQGVPKEKNSLTKLARTIQEKDGVALLSLQSIGSDNSNIRKKYIPEVHGIDEIVAEDITDELAKIDVPYDYIICDSRLDVSSIVQGDDYSPAQEGKDILSFILRKPWDSLSNTMRARIMRDIRSIVDVNGKPEFVLRDGYIWIPETTNTLVSPHSG